MLFLCFSSKDRYAIVESILYHLKNYGIKVWYDYHTLMLGDDKIQENINNGVKACDYVVLILSPNFFDCECGNMELDVIKAQYEAKHLYIFPILYNLEAKALPEQYSWIRNLIYNELNDCSCIVPTCNQIICKILIDLINKGNLETFQNLQFHENYLKFLHHTYQYLDEANISAKITILYSMYGYINKELNVVSGYGRILEQLFKYTSLNLTITFKELIIAENAIALIYQQQ